VGVFHSSLAPAPQITGVGIGASFATGIAPNSWITTIQGTNLSAATDTWDKAIVNGTLPTALHGLSVNVGGKPAYVSYVSPNQINAITPDAGTVSISVSVNSSGVPSARSQRLPYPYSRPFFYWPESIR
jgi:uncharacterized protein (TIGR03437 family)